MLDWRDRILKALTPGVARLTVVADPDGLLLEATLLEVIRERGFDFLTFDDPIAFRFGYESRFRSRWDCGDAADLEVIVRTERHNPATLPCDLLQIGRQISFGLGDLFPAFAYPVVASLDRSDLDALYQAQERHRPNQLGDNATRDFVLRHVFNFAPELVRRPSDLLRVLLQRHYRGQHLPRLLDERLVDLLRQSGAFASWPLTTILPDRDAFFTFLQERWPLFLDRLAASCQQITEEAHLPAQTSRTTMSNSGSGNTGDGRLKYSEGTSSFEIGGPADLPFGHADVRVYIDNLFVEGMLRPVSHASGHKLRGEWAAVGIQIAPETDRLRRFHRLKETVRTTLPEADAHHREWLEFAFRWAEFGVLLSQTASVARADSRSLIADPGTKQPDSDSSVADRATAPANFDSSIGDTCSAQEDANDPVARLRADVDRAFLVWLGRRYAGLHNQPPAPPVMVHHLPRLLARRLADSPESKVALVVVDGLAIDQWIVLRDALTVQRPRLRFREGAVFAWVPSITSVSRQAIFAGTLPLYFPASVLTTDREASRWTQFWIDHGLAVQEAGYAKGLGDGVPEGVRELVSRSPMRALGLVVDKVDKIMHGMTLGAAGMHNQVRQWAAEGFMAELLDMLLDGGFSVFLTSDHGNVEAEGQGRPAEGVMAEVRGARARIYADAVLRSRVKERFSDAIEWPCVGLPEDCHVLLAPRRTAFTQKGERVVGHGGGSLEEVVVPVVEIERAAA